MTTCPPIIVISIELTAQQVTVALPRPIVAVPTYLPSNAVVVGAGACAATDVADMPAAIVKSIIARPNMLLPRNVLSLGFAVSVVEFNLYLCRSMRMHEIARRYGNLRIS
jgi:hypothetical protein